MKKLVLLCVFSAIAGALLTRFFPAPAPPDDQKRGESALMIEQEPFGQRDDAVVELDDGGLISNDPRRGAATNFVVDGDVMTPDERVNVDVYEKVNRSVVNINTRSVRADPFMMFESPSEGAGSGSVIDRTGHILTNFHVIEGAREIQVTLFDGTTHDAKPVGVDPTTDLAVIRVDAPHDSLFPVMLGDSTKLNVGQKVLAIGNPFGLERTLTVGIISSLNRAIQSRNQRRIRSIIQTDAAINPGNSGGPLLDSRGRLIGVTTAIASRTGQSAGVGFAIPVSAVRRIVPQLVRDGRVVRADIGISRVVEAEQGLVIVSTTTNGPAEEAGLQGFRLVKKRRRQGPYVYEQTYVDRSAADVIVAVDGVSVSSAEQFLDLIESNKPGDAVTITIIREGKRRDVRVTLESDE